MIFVAYDNCCPWHQLTLTYIDLQLQPHQLQLYLFSLHLSSFPSFSLAISPTHPTAFSLPILVKITSLFHNSSYLTCPVIQVSHGSD